MPSLTAYGHSWVAGEGASRPGRGFSDLAARRLGCALTNCGVGGCSTRHVVELLAREPAPASEFYVLMTGLNDARLNGASTGALAAYTAALQAIFDTFRGASPGALIVAVAQPHLADYSLHAPHDQGADNIIDAYNGRLRAVAANRRGAVGTDVTGWDPATMLAADTVHPNDAGHAQIADAVVRAVAASASGRPRENRARHSATEV